MTALQDWLSYRPLTPRSLKMLICDSLRVPAAAEDAHPARPALLQPGLERC